MEIEPLAAFAIHEQDGQTFYFCSQTCVEAFDADPRHYSHPFTDEPPAGQAHAAGHQRPTTNNGHTQAVLAVTRVELPVAGLQRSGGGIRTGGAIVPGVTQGNCQREEAASLWITADSI
jgi:YHS domain-containing protein